MLRSGHDGFASRVMAGSSGMPFVIGSLDPVGVAAGAAGASHRIARLPPLPLLWLSSAASRDAAADGNPGETQSVSRPPAASAVLCAISCDFAGSAAKMRQDNTRAIEINLD